MGKRKKKVLRLPMSLKRFSRPHCGNFFEFNETWKPDSVFKQVTGQVGHDDVALTRPDDSCRACARCRPVLAKHGRDKKKKVEGTRSKFWNLASCIGSYLGTGRDIVPPSKCCALSATIYQPSHLDRIYNPTGQLETANEISRPLLTFWFLLNKHFHSGRDTNCWSSKDSDPKKVIGLADGLAAFVKYDQRKLYWLALGILNGNILRPYYYIRMRYDTAAQMDKKRRKGGGKKLNRKILQTHGQTRTQSHHIVGNEKE